MDPLVEAGFRVVAFDLPAHGAAAGGETDMIDCAAAVARVMAAQAERGHALHGVVAHSFGGAIALNLAAAHPNLVSGLVLLDPATGLDGSWMSEIADAMLGRMISSQNRELNGLAERLRRIMGATPVAGMPSNETVEAPVKLMPAISTDVPPAVGPLFGVTIKRVGATTIGGVARSGSGTGVARSGGVEFTGGGVMA